jgi:hypothetical protein
LSSFFVFEWIEDWAYKGLNKMRGVNEKKRPFILPTQDRGNKWPSHNYQKSKNYFLENFFFPRNASPIRPTPSKNRVDGSGITRAALAAQRASPVTSLFSPSPT